MAIIVLLAFVGMGLAWTAEQSTPRFQEKEGAPIFKKHKRFPWLPVLLGVGAGIVLVVLLTKTKKQTLTVNLNVGTAGTPAATAKFKKGSVISYNYTLKDGFRSLQVKIDGSVAPVRGTVTMDKEHAIDVSASEEFILTVDLGAGTVGTPATTASYPRDQLVDYQYSSKPSFGALQVRLDNIRVAASGTVTMSTSHTLSIDVSNDNASYRDGVLTINGIRYELAWIPAGEFQMGSDDPVADYDEKPEHTVLISKPFWIGKTEVPQELFLAVMGFNPSKFNAGGDLPVENTRWRDGNDFVQSLNQMLGGDAFRLPTEAEWEYACRAGTTGDRYGDSDAIAWYAANADGRPHPVGLKQPNAFGLYDMLGNVWEWTRDGWSRYEPGYQVDPVGAPPEYTSGHVYRGCSWETDFVCAYTREKDHPGDHSPYPKLSVGFRLARAVD